MNSSRISILGLWHLGCVTALGMAEKGHRVAGWDPDPGRVEGLSKGRPPLFEPGLEEGLREQISHGRLHFTGDLASAVKDAEGVVITFDTPLREDDMPDTSLIQKTTDKLASFLRPDVWVAVRSQVPVGTCEALEKKLRRFNPEWKAGLICWPENLRLGLALDSFRDPRPLVLGSGQPEVAEKISSLLAPLSSPPLVMNLRSAELAKHAINAFLAHCVAYANEVADCCAELGGDAVRVLGAVRQDPRVGNALPLRPGLPFAGGTLPRDLSVLARRASRPNLFAHILQANQRHARRVAARLEKLLGAVRGKEIAVLGLTYKPGTSTVRRSLAVAAIQRLCRLGACVRAYDPQADWDEISWPRGVRRARSPEEAAEGADLLAILTVWPEFKDIDYSRLLSKMRRPLLFDPGNLLDGAALAAQGIRYVGTGRGSL